ncbi:MAG: Do family serine endopeptidase [Bacteroidota bacterium]
MTSKKSVLAAVFLISLGIIFGGVLVSNFQHGVDFGLAGDRPTQVRLGASRAPVQADPDLQIASKAFVEVAKAVTPTVVSIIVRTAGKAPSEDFEGFRFFFGPDFPKFEHPPQQGAGSGVIVTQDGYVITNSHVVKDADEGGIEVTLSDKRRFQARLVGTDPTTDLAVVKIDVDGLTAAALGNSDELEVGQWVLAIGNPFTLSSTVTAGIVSALGRGQLRIIRDTPYGIENFIQTDAAINPGNSGGALVNLRGEVVGINTAIATTNARFQGYGFAIPVNLAKVVVKDLIVYGKVSRGYIGVQIKTIDATLAKALGLQRTQGVLVDNVVSASAAEEAGIKAGDVILMVDGRDVNAANELQTLIATRHPGDVVKLKIYRDGKTFEKRVTLRALDDEAFTTRASGQPKGKPEPDRKAPESISFEKLGLTCRNLTSEEKKRYKAEAGVLVSDVKRYSEADNRQLFKDDIILEADRKEIRSVGELQEVFNEHKPGDSVLLRVKTEETVRFVALQMPRTNK